MSGHSKWSTIKRKKGVADAKRGKIFTLLIRELQMAAKARGQNMPKGNIERAVKRGTGEIEGEALEEIRYEGYGPSGVAVIVEALTDNRNRTASEVRHLFAKYGGNLGSSGCVAYLFDKKGVLVFEDVDDSEALMEAAMDADAADVIEDAGVVEVQTTPESFEGVKQALEEASFVPASAEVAMIPQTTVSLDGGPAESMLKLMEGLDEHDDVKDVFANFDISEEVMKAAG